MAEYATPEEEWAALLSGTHPHLKDKSPLRFLPSSPRCKLCKAPFGAPGAVILRRYGYTPWPKQPKICGRCFRGVATQAQMCPTTGDGGVRGAEVELTMLFADVRGSSKLAREMPTLEFSALMDRFYRVSMGVLIEHDAVVEKFVGDEVVGLFIPFLVGAEHAGRAVETARALLRETGHSSADGPWIPLGVGVHTGPAFVGMVGADNASDFTALGDAVNLAAHLCSQAATGEILLTEQTATAAGLATTELERRTVSLKGLSLEALALRDVLAAS
jgi:adenylate cyclase